MRVIRTRRPTLEPQVAAHADDDQAAAIDPDESLMLRTIAR
jgi:hypothetical protein